MGRSGMGLGRLLSGDRPAAPVCGRVFRSDRGSRWDRGLPVDLRRMAPAAAPGFTIPAGGEDRVSVFARFGAISVAVLDVAPEPITQRVMELAVPAAERANAAAATDMGVSGSALKRGRHPNGMPSAVPARGSYYDSGGICNLGADPGRVSLGFTNNCNVCKA